MASILLVGFTHPTEITGTLPTEVLALFEHRFDGGAAFVTFQFQPPKPNDEPHQWYPDRDGAITLLPLSGLMEQETQVLQFYNEIAIPYRRNTAPVLWAAGLRLPRNLDGVVWLLGRQRRACTDSRKSCKFFRSIRAWARIAS